MAKKTSKDKEELAKNTKNHSIINSKTKRLLTNVESDKASYL